MLAGAGAAGPFPGLLLKLGLCPLTGGSFCSVATPVRWDQDLIPFCAMSGTEPCLGSEQSANCSPAVGWGHEGP